jgi:threonine dehydratase
MLMSEAVAIAAHAQSLHPLVAEVWRASDRLAGSGVLQTPLLASQWLGRPQIAGQSAVPASVHLKLENRQVTGSFKARGAVSKVKSKHYS